MLMTWLRRHAVGSAILATWTAITLWRSLVGFYSLGTNAFDLSVFDYALWGLQHGTTGFAAFFGRSEFSDHFDPILLLLVPAYAPFQSATALIVLQVIGVGAAGRLFVLFERRAGLGRGLSLALLVVYLFARRSHSATVSFFYPECLQPLLTFAVVLCWDRARWQYWTSVLLLLATKEDMAIALGVFGVLQWYRAPANRRRAIATLGLCACWLAFAMLVAIPASRAHDGLSGTHNPVFEARFSSESGVIDPALLAGRLLGRRSVGAVASVMAGTAFLPLGGLAWLAPALPGAILSLAATPDEMQATLMGHYAWPLLPWLFMAAATGLVRLHGRAPRLARALVVGLVAWTLFDSPTVRGVATTHRDPRAAEALSQLARVPGGVVLAQGNLIPHLPKSATLYAVGAETKPPRDPDWVLLTMVGNLWPLNPDSTAALIERYRRDAAYEEVFGGPLFGFKRRER